MLRDEGWVPLKVDEIVDCLDILDSGPGAIAYKVRQEAALGAIHASLIERDLKDGLQRELPATGHFKAMLENHFVPAAIHIDRILTVQGVCPVLMVPSTELALQSYANGGDAGNHGLGYFGKLTDAFIAEGGDASPWGPFGIKATKDKARGADMDVQDDPWVTGRHGGASSSSPLQSEAEAQTQVWAPGTITVPGTPSSSPSSSSGSKGKSDDKSVPKTPQDIRSTIISAELARVSKDFTAKKRAKDAKAKNGKNGKNGKKDMKGAKKDGKTATRLAPTGMNYALPIVPRLEEMRIYTRSPVNGGNPEYALVLEPKGCGPLYSYTRSGVIRDSQFFGCHNRGTPWPVVWIKAEGKLPDTTTGSLRTDLAKLIPDFFRLRVFSEYFHDSVWKGLNPSLFITRQEPPGKATSRENAIDYTQVGSVTDRRAPGGINVVAGNKERASAMLRKRAATERDRAVIDLTAQRAFHENILAQQKNWLAHAQGSAAQGGPGSKRRAMYEAAHRDKAFRSMATNTWTLGSTWNVKGGPVARGPSAGDMAAERQRFAELVVQAIGVQPMILGMGKTISRTTEADSVNSVTNQMIERAQDKFERVIGTCFGRAFRPILVRDLIVQIRAGHIDLAQVTAIFDIALGSPALAHALLRGTPDEATDALLREVCRLRTVVSRGHETRLQKERESQGGAPLCDPCGTGSGGINEGYTWGGQKIRVEPFKEPVLLGHPKAHKRHQEHYGDHNRGTGTQRHGHHSGLGHAGNFLYSAEPYHCPGQPAGERDAVYKLIRWEYVIASWTEHRIQFSLGTAPHASIDELTKMYEVGAITPDLFQFIIQRKFNMEKLALGTPALRSLRTAALKGGKGMVKPGGASSSSSSSRNAKANKAKNKKATATDEMSSSSGGGRASGKPDNDQDVLEGGGGGGGQRGGAHVGSKRGGPRAKAQARAGSGNLRPSKRGRSTAGGGGTGNGTSRRAQALKQAIDAFIAEK